MFNQDFALLAMAGLLTGAAFVASILAIWAIFRLGLIYNLKGEVEDLAEQLTRFRNRDARRASTGKTRSPSTASGPEPVEESTPDVDSRLANIERDAFRRSGTGP